MALLKASPGRKLRRQTFPIQVTYSLIKREQKNFSYAFETQKRLQLTNRCQYCSMSTNKSDFAAGKKFSASNEYFSYEFICLQGCWRKAGMDDVLSMLSKTDNKKYQIFSWVLWIMGVWKLHQGSITGWIWHCWFTSLLRLGNRFVYENCELHGWQLWLEPLLTCNTWILRMF